MLKSYDVIRPRLARSFARPAKAAGRRIKRPIKRERAEAAVTSTWQAVDTDQGVYYWNTDTDETTELGAPHPNAGGGTSSAGIMAQGTNAFTKEELLCEPRRRIVLHVDAALIDSGLMAEEGAQEWCEWLAVDDASGSVLLRHGYTSLSYTAALGASPVATGTPQWEEWLPLTDPRLSALPSSTPSGGGGLAAQAAGVRASLWPDEWLEVAKGIPVQGLPYDALGWDLKQERYGALFAGSALALFR